MPRRTPAQPDVSHRVRAGSIADPVIDLPTPALLCDDGFLGDADIPSILQPTG